MDAFNKALGLKDEDRLANDACRHSVLRTKRCRRRQLVSGGECAGRNLLTNVIRELRPLRFGGHLVSLVCTAI
ncbi:hypothetical protein BDK92_1397 [Micromonospora pisi]|uniref:Uncharacterized protein n=1 Tax=Micromonospora pisi TaxID=589240 RepID=A0A495JFG9_9ACTN|nr:hypothetical protein BDK92_1397 [Micromonospora pisi]